MLDFFTQLHDAGLGYSALNTARSALSTFMHLDDSLPVGKHPLIKRFLKAVYQIQPTVPRYTHTWDVLPVLTFLQSLHPLHTLSLRMLTLKLVMLTALVTGQRCQSLHLINLDYMTIYEQGVKFLIMEPVKQSAPGRQQPVLILPLYEDDKLCAVTCLNYYIKCTNNIRTSSKLFISYSRPHKPVAKETVSRWIKNGLKMSCCYLA